MNKLAILFFCAGLGLMACNTVKNAGEFPVDKDWKLIELEGQAVPANVNATIKFEAATKRFGGKGPCNTYGGTYELNGAALSLGQTMATKMFCSEVASWETGYFQMFEKVDGYAHAGGKLSLLAGDVKVAVFE